MEYTNLRMELSNRNIIKTEHVVELRPNIFTWKGIPDYISK